MASKSNVKKIKSIQFSLSNPADILKYSVCEVSTLDLYDKNEPNFHSLFDTRMGIVDTKYKCSTCEHPIQTCPGHFGHIQLVKKVYIPHFLKTVVRTLQIVCVACSKILKEAPNNNKNNSVKFNSYYNLSKEKTLCMHCGEIQPKISKDNINIYTSAVNNGQSNKEKTILTANECFSILEMISDDDCKKLGFNPELSRPEWMIFSVIPVGPPCIRPSVHHDGGTRSECDLTYKYIDIIKCNTALKTEMDRNIFEINKKKEELELEQDVVLKQQLTEELPLFILKKERILEDRYNHLQIHVITVMNNKLSNVPISQNRSNRPFKCFTEKIASKSGRIRGNLMGKRVDFSARSVITPDPMISIDELGVPILMAIKLSINELVNKYNIDNLQKCVNNGPDIHPGALFITKEDGKKVSLNIIETQVKTLTDKQTLTDDELTLLVDSPVLSENEKVQLKDFRKLGYFKDILVLKHGDYVERHIADGDYVLFNRQPSLHKMSMMAHKVRVLEGQTFRLNPNVCTPYNADFDGDEMNAHIPRSIQASIELSEIVAVPYQIISPQSNKPVIGCIQDTLLGCKKITADNVSITRNEMMDILGYVDLPFELAHDKLTWSGRELISLFIPKMNYRNGEVIIKNGQLIAGQMVKKHMGTSSGSLIHVIWNDYGALATRDFINNIQMVINRWLLSQGASVGLSDTIADHQTLQDINKIVDQSQLDVFQEIAKYEHKQYQAQDATEIQQEFEAKVVNMLNATRDSTGSLASKNVFSNNRINDMVTAGSKGSNLNISQIMANVGQQVVKTDGRTGRVEDGFIDRPLPHMTKYDISPHARGFVSSSYLQGLDPVEFFYHSMSGREGLIDTAIKTSETQQ
jgi:DNA-directed RNA polymerase II subunit RPB1